MFSTAKDGQFFEPDTRACMFNKKANEFYITLVIIMLLVVCGFLLPFFYIKIFILFKNSRQRALSHNYFKRKQMNSSFKMIKGLFYSFLFFAISYIAFFSLVLIKEYQPNIPSGIFMYLYLFARSNSVFNPILYTITNPLFQNGLKKMFFA